MKEISSPLVQISKFLLLPKTFLSITIVSEAEILISGLQC